MGTFIARRVGQGVLTIAILAVLVFVLSRVTGDPLNTLVPIEATPAQKANLARQLGLDKPLYEQFIVYMGNLLTGDLGMSFTHRVPVADLFSERIFNSLALVIPAFIMVIILGPVLGVIGATSRFSIVRKAVLIFATLGIALPVFWVGLVLVRFFAVQLGWLPASRMGDWKHYVLPVASLSLMMIAGMMRLVRSSMLDSLGRDYIKLAESKAYRNAPSDGSMRCATRCRRRWRSSASTCRCWWPAPPSSRRSSPGPVWDCCSMTEWWPATIRSCKESS